MTVQERFEQYVIPEPNSGCLWLSRLIGTWRRLFPAKPRFELTVRCEVSEALLRISEINAELRRAALPGRAPVSAPSFADWPMALRDARKGGAA